MADIKDLVNDLKNSSYDPKIANPDLKFIKGDPRYAAMASVANATPNTVQINDPDAIKNAGSDYIMAHEVDHTLGNRAQQYAGIDNPVGKQFRDRLNAPDNAKVHLARENIMHQNYAKLAGLEPNSLRAGVNITDFWKRMGNPELGEYIDKTYGVKPIYLGNAKNNRALEEGIADLSAIETTRRKDLTQDPFIRKKLFNNDDDLIQAYKSITGLRTQRLDARDLPPFTVSQPPSTFEKLRKSLGFKYGGQVKSKSNVDKPIQGGSKTI